MEKFNSKEFPFAYFSDKKYFEILKKFKVSELQNYLKKNKKFKRKREPRVCINWTTCQKKVLDHVDNFLSSSDSQPIYFILTGQAGMHKYLYSHCSLVNWLDFRNGKESSFA